MTDQPIRTDWIARHAMYQPDALAIVWRPNDRTLTYAQCHHLANQLAAKLADTYDISKGDRVGVVGLNSLEHVLLFFAAQRMGAVLVPVNFRLATPEIAHVLEDCAPEVLFFDASVEETVSPLDADFDVTLAPLSGVLADLDAHDASTEWEGPAFDDPAMILYTSGTTGAPKGAIVTHRMLFFNAVSTAMRLDLTSHDRTMNAAPLYHTGGWNVLSTPLWHRGGCVVMMEGFDAAEILDVCAEEALTIVWGVPTMMRMMAEADGFPDADLATVRYALVGGEPMPEDLIQIWQERDVPIRQGFGMTEVGPNCFSLPEADAIRKIGSIGTPNFYVEVRLVDDAHVPVAEGHAGEGELVMRGPAVTPGYWGRPEATAKAFTEDGWFLTGDLLRRDEEGYYYVMGRRKEMFISGGENVYPAEVESALRAHTAIEDVVVVGVPDARWGEVGACFVVVEPGEEVTAEDVRAFGKTKLAKFKVPRHVFFVEEFPLGASGKIDKMALTERAHVLQGEGKGR